MRLVLPSQWHQHRHEAVAIAIAAIGVGMFIGTWVIGPAVSYSIPDRPSDIAAPMGFQAMLAQPDPFAFRTPTPAFDASGAPAYAATAKAKAQAELGGESSADEDWQPQALPSNRAHHRYRVPDRHRPLF